MSMFWRALTSFDYISSHLLGLSLQLMVSPRPPPSDKIASKQTADQGESACWLRNGWCLREWAWRDTQPPVQFCKWSRILAIVLTLNTVAMIHLWTPARYGVEKFFQKVVVNLLKEGKLSKRDEILIYLRTYLFPLSNNSVLLYNCSAHTQFNATEKGVVLKALPFNHL